MLYQLRWLSEPIQPAKVLPAGDHGIGSDDRNEIRITQRGVSRFHATLSTRAHGCELKDRGSKNGSTVNGRRVEHSSVRPGDVLGFGTARGVLERIERDDVELAVAVDWSTRGRPTTRLSRTSETPSDAPLDARLPTCVDRLLIRLRMAPAPDLDGAMADLAQVLELRGTCLAEWPQKGPPRVLAAAGELAELPTRKTLLEAPRLPFGHDARAVKVDDGLVATCRGPGEGSDPDDRRGEVLGLAVFGAASAGVERVLLATCLRILREATETPADLEADARSEPPDLRLPEGIVASASPAMESVYRQVVMVAADPVPVLILGETGVGKEHLARALHNQSPRSSGPFVAINCAAMPSELLEAELFGIGSGVATGVAKRLGKLVQADGGTLFLDEIGDMPAALQAKLLRALQDGEVTPLGEAPTRVDVRWVAATHTDLEQAIADGRFREDLYFRLAGFELRIPPLRHRCEDLPRLVGSFLQEFGRQSGRTVRGVTVKALRHLTQHSWPGNVRQLRHVVRRLVYLCPPGGAINSDHVTEAVARSSGLAPRPADFELGSMGLDEYLHGHERAILERALAQTDGNQTQAANLLRISRNKLARRVQRLGLEAD